MTTTRDEIPEPAPGLDDEYEEAAGANWKDKLDLTAAGTVRKNLFNACVALRDHPTLKSGIAYDEFSGCTYVLKALPWDPRPRRPWSQHDDLAATVWLQSAAVGVLVGSTIAREAVESVAYENRFHPVVGWLEALKWDGTERLTKWLTTCLGVPSTGLANAIGRKFLISAVARVMRPGSKVDHMLILEGPQGILKSTALRTLVGDDWFTDQIADLGTKDSCQDLHGKWIIELSELSAIRPGEVERVKAYISRQIDHYRPSYGRRSGDMPRQCAFVGTTNAKEYLSDTTGGRRFWPVLCTRIDIDRLAADRDQLWAEAVAAYHKGESWWLDNDELRRAVEGEQEDRRTQDPWESIIADWLDDPTQLDRDGIRIPLALEEGRVTNAQILEHAIAKPVERQTVADQMRVGRTLIRLGWQKRRVGRAKVMMWENTASHQEEVDTPANEPARCVHQVCPPQPRSQPSCGIPDIPDTPTRVCVTPCGQNYESGPRGVSSVSTSNGGAPDACVGNCTYCRDAVYPDDVVRAESGLLHHRCVDLWVAR